VDLVVLNGGLPLVEITGSGDDIMNVSVGTEGTEQYSREAK
jgi:hypothetical protein